MLKKILFVSLVFLLNSSAAFAYGTYMGLGIGMNSTSYTLKDATNTSYQYNVRYPTVGVFVGDGTVLKNNFYLAGEFFVSDGTGTTSYRNIENNTISANISSTYSYGADVIPGYVTGKNKNTLFYGRLGIVGTRMQLRGMITPTGIAAGVDNTKTVPQTYAGGRFGVGVQQSFSRFIKARAEFVHTAYRGLSVLDSSGLMDGLKPSSNQFNLAFIYEFA